METSAFIVTNPARKPRLLALASQNRTSREATDKLTHWVEFTSVGECRHCGKCREDCPLQVEIPELTRAHMYIVQYANHGLATDTLAAINPGKGLDACASCHSCQANCRETVNISRKIADLKQITSKGVFRA